MNNIKLSIEQMISNLDTATGMLIVHGKGNPVINEARELIISVSLSLGEYANDIADDE